MKKIFLLTIIVLQYKSVQETDIINELHEETQDKCTIQKNNSHTHEIDIKIKQALFNETKIIDNILIYICQYMSYILKLQISKLKKLEMYAQKHSTEIIFEEFINPVQNAKFKINSLMLLKIYSPILNKISEMFKNFFYERHKNCPKISLWLLFQSHYCNYYLPTIQPIFNNDLDIFNALFQKLQFLTNTVKKYPVKFFDDNQVRKQTASYTDVIDNSIILKQNKDFFKSIIDEKDKKFIVQYLFNHCAKYLDFIDYFDSTLVIIINASAAYDMFFYNIDYCEEHYQIYKVYQEVLDILKINIKHLMKLGPALQKSNEELQKELFSDVTNTFSKFN